MGSRRRNVFVLMFILGLLFASAYVIKTKDTKLGLDLKGGTELVYEARGTPQNPTVEADDITQSINIIRQRTDKLGVAEPEISQLGTNSIVVGLPDVQNADRAIEQVGTTAQLYFYDWEPNVVPRPNLPASSSPTETPFPREYDAVLAASKQKPITKAECAKTKCTVGTQYYLFNKTTKQIIKGPEERKSDLFADFKNEKQPKNSEIITVPEGTIVISDSPSIDRACATDQCFWVLHDMPAISGADIKDPKAGSDPNTSQPNVSFSFTDTGKNEFQQVTKDIAERGQANAIPGVPADQQSGHFAVILDGEIKSRAIVDYSQYPGGIDGRTGAEISGLDGPGEAEDLATTLRIGALPVKLVLVSQTTVSATLGQEALDQGLKAGIIGLILILLFLLAYYRFLGLVASIGLIVYMIIFFALIKAIPITLTLPGIAGLILTIGVAADANIIIFERIKEEARGGKSIPSAIATGYRKGIATIVDANVITLITAFILFVLATAGVKGFAFTLGVGTIVSLLTAVVFTQAFLGFFGRSKMLRSGSLIGAGKERVRWHFDFSGASRWFFSLSGCILIAGAIGFATLGLNFGIDFESGTRVKAALDQPASVEQVRSSLSDVGVGDAEVQSVKDPQFGKNVFQIATELDKPRDVQKIQRTLESNFGIAQDGFNSQSIGPTFGAQVAKSAVYALIFSLLVIAGYVAFRFEPKYAVPVLIALFHDILITGGVYSLSGRELTSGTVAAFLTILGYSLYDTVIVFDRVRENVPRLPRAAFSQIVNRSMSEVLTRSLITGASTVFLVGVLFLFGGATLKDFAFAMMIGILSGTYSSIFIASPVLTHWKEREPLWVRREARIEELMGYVPAFPEDNVIERLGDEPAEAPTPAAVATVPRSDDRGEGNGGDVDVPDGAGVPELPPVDPGTGAPAQGIPGVTGPGAPVPVPPAEEPPPAPAPSRAEPPAGRSRAQEKRERRERRTKRRRKHGRNR